MPEGQWVVRNGEDDHVEVLTLSHPPVNALSTALLAELDEQLTALPKDTRALILTGDGQYFSAGADLKEVASTGFDEAPTVIARTHVLLTKLATFHAPVLAAINGLALGGGLELALCCDLRIAGESAKLGSPEVKYGLMPAYGGTQRLTRVVGLAKAKELIFTGSMLSAADALRIGLVNKVVPAGQELRAARDLAHTIAQQAPKAVAASKRAIDEGFDLPLREGLRAESEAFEESVLRSPDLVEGVTAFVERRPPKFTGE
jgi:enoyl-CoA hydratase